jgi:tetratricopeptide (TPR) repeat protein
VYIEKEGVKCPAEWIEEFSDMKKDFAVLNVKGCDTINVKPLVYAKEAMPKLSVLVWGFSGAELETFPEGSPIEDGELSSDDFGFQWKEEDVKGDEKWNKKPVVSVRVFRISGRFDVGYSGAPVCYTANSNVVGIFTAKDSNYGYVIPIQAVLEKFEVENKLAKPSSSMVDVSSYLEKAHESYDKGDFNEGLKHLEIILKDRNFFATLYNKGLFLERLGKHEEAIEWFNRVLDIEPKYTNALGNKGFSLFGLEKYKEAIQYFDRALAIDPNYIKALNNKKAADSKLEM